MRFLIPSAFFSSAVTTCCPYICVYSPLSPWQLTAVTDVVYYVCKRIFPSTFFPAMTAKSTKSLPCDTLMFLPTLRPFILESCCFWTEEMHIWMLTNHFLLQNISLSLQQLIPPLPHTHAHNLLLHHNPSAEMQQNPKLWSAACEVSFAWENQAAIFNIIMLPNYMVLIGNCLITLSGIWKASVWP